MSMPRVKKPDTPDRRKEVIYRMLDLCSSSDYTIGEIFYAALRKVAVKTGQSVNWLIRCDDEEECCGDMNCSIEEELGIDVEEEDERERLEEEERQRKKEEKRRLKEEKKRLKEEQKLKK